MIPSPRLKTLSLLIILFSVTAVSAKEIHVGLVLDRAGKDDKSFNASAYEGAQRAKKELGIKLNVVEPRDDASYEPSIEQVASRDVDLTIAVGFSMQEAVERVARRYPKKSFA